MRKIKLIFIGVMLSLLSACSQGPETVAENFVLNMANGHYDKTRELLAPNLVGNFDKMVASGKAELKPNIQYIFVETKISEDGNEAKVLFKDGENSKTEHIKLVKLDDGWKVTR